MKRKTAKEILAEAFREVAEGKPVDAITVKDITENCGYSPATFYRQFKDKYDLIAWDYSRKVGQIMERVGEDDYAWRDALYRAIHYYDDEKEYLANLFRHTNGLDSFLRNMTEINDRHLSACVKEAMDVEKLDERIAIIIHLYCHGTVAIVCEWVLGEYNVAADALAEVFEQSLPEPLKKYLIRQ